MQPFEAHPAIERRSARLIDADDDAPKRER
jgi:hypothetical protein